MNSTKVLSNPTHFVNMQDRFGLRFGFLTSGYRNEYYYWEVLLILRKTVVVFLITFFAPISKGVQSLGTIIVLGTYLLIHLKTSPFYDKKLNDMETYSLMALIVTIYFGLVYQSSKESATI